MKNRLGLLSNGICRSLPIILFVLNLWFYARGAAGWWVGSRVSGDCASVAEARLSEDVSCAYQATTGLILGGMFYIVPDQLNLLTIVPLVRSFSSMCNCTAFRVEMGGILLFSSLQAIFVGYGIKRLVLRRN